LIIEVDGDIHDQQIEHDLERSQYLTHYGYRVIRFRNEDVLQKLDTVLSQIAEASRM
jgi:very-short-patch-repair endonuclease